MITTIIILCLLGISLITAVAFCRAASEADEAAEKICDENIRYITDATLKDYPSLDLHPCEKLGKDPAFPVESKEYGNIGINEIGMSKRFYAACAAMQGLLAAHNINEDLVDAVWTARNAFIIADELLKQENE